MTPSLELFPYPFTERLGPNGLLLVLAERPRRLDYDVMLEVAAGLGAADQGDSLALNVTTAGVVSLEDRMGRDLILIGRPSLHPLIAELNEELPQPFEPGSDLLRPQLESVFWVQDPLRDIGVIEELAAPWDPERTILVITGVSDEGVTLAGTTLFDQGEALDGNIVLVEESVGIRGLDTRSLLSDVGGQVTKVDAGQTVLIQLSKRWW